jgi:putative acetyltransferase
MERQPAPEHMPIMIRPYKPSDAAGTLAVFISAVKETASADYTAEQIHAWAQPDRRDVVAWNAAISVRNSVVATIGGALAGFSDVSLDGYVDMMFVSPRHQRRGVARQLLEHLEAQARSERTPTLSADVSITARPFFERHGFTAEAEQHPVRAGVELTNYRMRKVLRPNEAAS